MTRRQPAFREKTCDGCGEPFIPNSGRQRWCLPGGCRSETEAAARTVVEAEPEPLVGAPPALDPELYERVREAISANEDAISEGCYEDGWRSTAWTFARVLRDHPDLITLDADAAADAIEPYLEAAFPAEEWVAGPEGVPDAWSRNLGEYDSASRPMNALEDFFRVWPVVHAPAIQVALANAAGPPYYEAEVFGAALSAPRRAPFRRFLAVCRELCRVAEEREGDGVAALPVQALATALGTDRRTVGGWRQEAERRRYIEQVRPPSRYGGPAGRAGEYRWIARERERRTFEPAPGRAGGHPAKRRGRDDEPGF